MTFQTFSTITDNVCNNKLKSFGVKHVITYFSSHGATSSFYGVRNVATFIGKFNDFLYLSILGSALTFFMINLFFWLLVGCKSVKAEKIKIRKAINRPKAFDITQPLTRQQ